MTAPKPLSWSVDWVHLDPVEKLMMGFPLVGTQNRVYSDLVAQLETRTAADAAAWQSYGNEVQTLEQTVSRILIERLDWPKTSIFLPDDPADIPFWDRTGDLAGVEAMLAVEDALGVELPEQFLLDLEKMTYAEALKELNRMRTKPGTAANDGSATPPGSSGATERPPSGG